MDAEEKARTMGWVPKEEFKGDPDRWVSAEQFNERGDTILPIMKERMGKFETRIDTQTAEIEKLNSTVKNVLKLSKTASQRAYQKAVRDLKTQQRDAVANQDLEKFDEIDREITELNKDLQGDGEGGYDQTNGDPHPDFQTFQDQNMWYNTDNELTAFANGTADAIAKEGSNLVGVRFYDEVIKRTKKAFPHKFANPNKGAPNPVEGGDDGSGDGKSSKKKTYRDLDADARAACDDFVAQGLFTREEYIADYFEGA